MIERVGGKIMTSSFALDAFVATTCQRARGIYQECEQNSKNA